jgi:CDGSH-type Zn-finger protein
MCGCGKTQNAEGHCDGSHAKPAPKQCGCGKTQNAEGHCDGSHAR